MTPVTVLGLPDVLTSGCDEGVEFAFLGDEDADDADREAGAGESAPGPGFAAS